MNWFIASALAQTVEPAEIQQMVGELQPRVEAALGRPPIGTLEAGILPRNQVRAAIQAPAPAVGSPIRQSRNRANDEPVVNQGALDSGIAVYVGQTRSVWVVQEALDELAAREDLPPEQLRPVLRCLMVHEIVHGIQHAYGTIPTDVDADQLDGFTALREGHATRVELDLCAAWEGPEVARVVALLRGIDAAATLAPEASASGYAWGRALVGLMDREDPELVWSALAGPPPRWSDLARDLQPIVGGGWQDAAPVTAALREDQGAARWSGLKSLAALLEVPKLALPLVPAGWFAETPNRVVAAFWTTEPGLPAAIVGRRDERTRGAGGYLMTSGDLVGDLVLDRGTLLEGRPDVARSLRLDLSTTDGAGAYHERWVATEHVLLVMVTRSGIGPAGDDDALVALLDQLPQTGPTAATTADLPALGEWLDGVRARKGDLEPTFGPQWRLLDAALAWQGGGAAPCGPAFGDTLVPGVLRHPEAQAAQAYACAVAADETETADRAALMLGALPPIQASGHARNLLAQGRLDDALAILDRATPSDARGRRIVADTRMRTLREARRWEELSAVAKGPEGSPAIRIEVADSLREIGWPGDASVVFAAACAPGDDPLPMACWAL